MPKSITISSVKIYEFSINQEDSGAINVAVVYELLDSSGVSLLKKRTDFKNVSLNAVQKTAIANVRDALITIIKGVEGI